MNPNLHQTDKWGLHTLYNGKLIITAAPTPAQKKRICETECNYAIMVIPCIRVIFLQKRLFHRTLISNHSCPDQFKLFIGYHSTLQSAHIKMQEE